ncbi:hypothetical protein CHS0354_010257 [Potamilus streckersoni]|uniref:Uncharacterized protein n=1 Tax=Potamilus streckersoni TaxID=2493646 RepID=A0AAE0RSM9_9BIVA|nr:hypothetical protein CHS0354_010257 [Potamilus streckersoni]
MHFEFVGIIKEEGGQFESTDLGGLPEEDETTLANELFDQKSYIEKPFLAPFHPQPRDKVAICWKQTDAHSKEEGGEFDCSDLGGLPEEDETTLANELFDQKSYREKPFLAPFHPQPRDKVAICWKQTDAHSKTPESASWMDGPYGSAGGVDGPYGSASEVDGPYGSASGVDGPYGSKRGGWSLWVLVGWTAPMDLLVRWMATMGLLVRWTTPMGLLVEWMAPMGPSGVDGPFRSASRVDGPYWSASGVDSSYGSVSGVDGSYGSASGVDGPYRSAVEVDGSYGSASKMGGIYRF